MTAAEAVLFAARGWDIVGARGRASGGWAGTALAAAGARASRAASLLEATEVRLADGSGRGCDAMSLYCFAY